MTPRLILVIVLFYNLYTTDGNKDDLELPDYDYYRDRHYVGKQNLRERFLQRKSEKKAKEKQMKLLNEYSSKDTELLNGVPHLLVDKKSNAWDKIHQIEEGMKKIIAAVGLNYVYKRDHFWRTWKKVKYSKNVTKVICYKCNNVISSTCEKCRNSGFWTIEDEPPPCSIELFSLIDRQQACGVKFTQLYNYSDSCPVTMNFAEIMSSCDNPIRTSYRITRSFKKSKSLPFAICGADEDYCEISTVYRIYKDYVVYKIIKSNNEVIYSRLMKPGKINYICVINCGRIDSKNNNVTNEKVNNLPLSVNLLPKRSIKQETSLQETNMHNTTAKKIKNKKHKVKSKKAGKRKKIKTSIRRYEESLKHNIKTIKNLLKKVKSLSNDTKTVTESICTRLGKKATTTEDYEEKDSASGTGE